MARPFSQTLSFDDLEVLVLVENGGASPRELEVSLGTGTHQTKPSAGLRTPDGPRFSTWVSIMVVFISL
jgi:hypothetical protein